MRQGRDVIAWSMFLIVILLVQGCGLRWWGGSESDQEGPAQEELIKEQAIKEIPPDDSQLTDSRTSPTMQSELLSRNATGFVLGTLDDVLFDLDRDTLRVDAMRALETNAKELQHDSVTHLVLEGRGDESGTSAYNLILGERRARNVQSYLQELGLLIDVKTTSYGKDRPLCFEHSGECSQKNRSVHFVVQ
jgi:peptidoglycan-associated lipoprotein